MVACSPWKLSKTELARLGHHHGRPEVGGRAGRVRLPDQQAASRRRLLEVGDPLDLAGGHGVADHHRGLLGQHHLEPLGLQALAVELAHVERARRRGHETLAEGVLAARIQRERALDRALVDQRRQRAVVVGVPVAEDQRVGPGRIDLEDCVIVREVQLGQREVEQDLAALRSAHGLQMVGQAVLGQEGASPAERCALHRDRVQLRARTLGEDVVHVVDDVGQDQAIDGGDGSGALGRHSPAGGEPAEGDHAATDGTQPEDLASMHDVPPRMVRR